jgi:hypothetical protein
MKIYYYIQTGHKKNLDRLKRGIALIKRLKENNLEVELILNDFRAGLVAKEFGLNNSITVETIMDIDVLIDRGDTLIIDTDEDKNRIEVYSKEYNLFRITDDINDTSRYGEKVINIAQSPLVDSYYLEKKDKVERVVFFYSDSDSTKEILKQSEFFKEFNFDLILGNYFYLGYEDELAPYFNNIYEPEDYIDIITTSQTVVTCSKQSAIEAQVSGAKVIYIQDNFDVNKIKDELNKTYKKEDIEINKAVNMLLSKLK